MLKSTSELSPPLPARPYRQVLRSSNTKTQKNSPVRSLPSSFVSEQIERKISATSSILSLQTSASTAIVKFPLPPRSHRDVSCDSSDSVTHRNSSGRSLSSFSCKGIKILLQRPQCGQGSLRSNLSSNEIINTSLQTPDLRRGNSALELALLQSTATPSRSRKDSSYHSANDSSSLSLSRTDSVDLSVSDQTSTVSLSSFDGSRGSTPPQFASFTSISESSRILPVPDISLRVAEIIHDSLESRT